MKIMVYNLKKHWMMLHISIVYIDLEMLLGLLSITGSAEYLHLEELDEDEVSISLSFKSQKFSEVLPYGVKKDFKCVLNLLF